MHLLTSSTIIVLLVMCCVKGHDYNNPRLLTSISGDTVRMECNRTVEGTVDWKVDYDPYGTLGYICNNGRVTDIYRPRMEVDSDNYTLTIHDVMVNDSGRYYCVDSAGRHDFIRLDVVLLPPGHLGLVNRTETSLAISLNQTGLVTGYTVSANGQTASDVTYTGIESSIVTAAIHNMIPGSRYSVSVWSSRFGIFSKTSSTANYSTVPAAPEVVSLVNQTEKCLTISWNQRGRVTGYEVMLDDSCPLNTRYIGVGTEFVTAVLCCLSIGTQYKVSITAVSDGDRSQATSVYFETLPRPYSPPVTTITVGAVVPIVCLLIGCVVAYVVYRRLQDIQPVAQEQRSFIEFNQSGLIEMIAVVWNGFLSQLQTAKCITDKERQLIASSNDPTIETRQLLEVLKKSRRREFNVFVRYMHEIDQIGIASALAAGEGVLVNVELEITTGDDREPIKSVRPQQLLFIPNNATQMPSDMIQQLGPDLVLISILLHNVTRAHFHCKTVMGLHLFDELCITGQLTNMLQQLVITGRPTAAVLQQVIGSIGSKSQVFSISRLIWRTTDYLRCTRYFHQQQDLLTDIYKLCPFKETFLTSSPDETCYRELMIETQGILKVVIFKAAVQFFRVFSKMSGGSDVISLTILSAVCKSWRIILADRHLKTRLLKHFDHVCRPYICRPLYIKKLDTKSDGVRGLTQLDDKIFVVCVNSDTIRVFGLNNERLKNVKVKGLKRPRDIVACSETRSLYVADWWADYVWRVSMDGQVDKFKTSSFSPWSLSVTSGRLLVTAWDDVLLLYTAGGVEVNRLSFTDMFGILHAVETSRGTFIICHLKPQPQVVEVDSDRRIISVYNDQQQLAWPLYLSIDSEGKIFIADGYKHHILLLTGDLQLDRVLLDRKHNQLVKYPWRLLYVQQTQQLLVGSSMSPVSQVFALG